MVGRTRARFLVLFATLGCGSAVDPGGVEETDGSGDATDTAPSTGDTPTTDTAATSDAPTATGGDTDDTEVPADVTYHRDIRPLIERHCVSCHSEGNIGPFELGSYDDVFAIREVVQATIESNTMPPWGMAEDCGEFVGDPSLSPEDKALVAAWVEAGGPEGDPNDYVAPQPLPQPELTRTDLTLQLPEPYEPQLSPDDYRCFLIDWPETEPTYVTGYQFEADNTSITHHAIVYVIDPADVEEYEALDAADPGPGYTCFGGPGGNQPLDFIRSRWLGAWAPGTRVGDLPAGTGLRVEPGSKVAVQMHYNTLAANGEPDQSAIHYKLDASVQREAFMMPWANPEWLGGGMKIPAGTDDTVHTFAADPTSLISFMTDIIPPDSPIEVFRSIHHMHRRGSRGYQAILHGDGTTECMVEIPGYDYAWQMSYAFTQSKIIEPGDQLLLECQWDNLDNDQAVGWGDGTDDEMCLGILYVAPAQ